MRGYAMLVHHALELARIRGKTLLVGIACFLAPARPVEDADSCYAPRVVEATWVVP